MLTRLWSNRVVRNTLSLFTGQTGAQLLALVFTIYLARVVPRNEYGALMFAFSFVVVFNVLSEYGLWTLLVRNMAREPAQAADYFWNSVVLKLALSVVAAIIGIIVLVAAYPVELRVVTCLAGGWLLFNAWYFSAAAVFRAFQEHHFDGSLSFIGKLLYVGLGLALIHFTRDVRWIAAVFTLAMAVQCGLAFAVVRARHRDFTFTFSLGRQWFLLRHAWLFFAINLFTTVHLRFAHLVIGKECAPSAVGFYNVAFMLVMVPIVLANAFVQSMYPVLAESHERGDAEFWPKARSGFRWLGALAFPVIVYMTIEGRRVLGALFPPEFSAALLPMLILLWGLGLDFFNPFSGHILYVLNRQKVVIGITATSVVVNIIANLVLVPWWGITGASVAMVLSLSVMFWGYAWALRHWLPVRSLLQQILPPLGVAAALAPIVLVLAWRGGPVSYALCSLSASFAQHRHVLDILVFVINGGIYFGLCVVALFCLRILRWQDIKMFGGT